MEIRIIIYKASEGHFKPLYELLTSETGESPQEQLISSQWQRRRHEEALKKAKAMGLYCIPGGKSQEGGPDE